MGAILELGKQSVYIDTLKSKNEKYRNKVTQFPVESDQDGSQNNPITDDIINQNDVINIKGIVSGSPIVFMASLSTYSINITDSIKKGEIVKQQFTSPNDAKRLLKDFSKSGKTIKLSIDDEYFDNAAIADLEIKSDSDTGDSLFVELKLEIIKKVVSKTTTVPDNIADQKTQDDNSKKADLGHVAAKPVEKGTFEYQLGTKAISFTKGLF
ncbi:phage baseplate protein [Piscirickettsia litoralis]|uniref:Dit-like phage tail protein N-terminal domain-containing protein n=1 Tax=Piscirickettsia litoralis TaxID=1891921 RepID=A0ABX3A100_9GAMM|nr:hypothetical protein [Piscirickettsia litoralis]ODN41075.1 hypothetical protein BGC07_18180 [Piscirickettsia litoralis]